MIYSIHIHKTAGTSFRHGIGEVMEPSIASLYVNNFGQLCLMGKDGCDFDNYLNMKIESTPDDIFKEIERRKAIIIHGHYCYSDIDLFTTPIDSVITWIRNPVDRMISDWRYWVSRYLNMNNTSQRRMFTFSYLTKILKGTPVQFNEFIKRQRNIYQRTVGNIPLEIFKFIGESENYELDLEQLSYMLSVLIPVKKSNVTPLICDIPESNVNMIKEEIQEDMKVYNRLLEFKREKWG